jgi:SAM-dependent methyltransferase
MFSMASATRPAIFPAARKYWSDCVDRSSVIRGSWEFLAALWEFVRDSTPSRLRSRFGDANYDWDYRVNTTSGAVGWHDRLLGVFNSPYQPTERELFHEMMDALAQHTKINFEDFTFIDLGSGKGRTLLMAANYPFRRILGVELLPSLNQIAQQNLAQYHTESQKCSAIESICADATKFALPEGALVIYLFNPFPESGLRRALANLEDSLEAHPRPTYVVYHNPQLEAVLNETGRLKRILGTHQYSIFAAN